MNRIRHHDERVPRRQPYLRRRGARDSRGVGGNGLLLRDRREPLACQEYQAFPDLAKTSMPRDRDSHSWTSSSLRLVMETSVARVSVCPLGFTGSSL